MSTFWMLAVSMTAIALAFTIPPLFSSSRESKLDRNQLNAEVIKDQLRELRADLEAGKLDKQAYQAARQDLERELLNDLDDDTGAATAAPRSGRWIAGVLLVFIPALAYVTYQQLGAPGIMSALARLPATQTQKAGNATQQQHSIEEMVEKLEQRMREQPDNAEGWIMLGRSYSSMKRYQDAAKAYAQAYRLVDNDAALITDYADVMVTANGGEFTDEAGELLNKALALQPGNVKALWLLGHWKHQRGDYQGAIDSWQRVADVLPAGDKNVAVINQQIQQAKNVMAEKGIVLAAEKSVPADNAAPVSNSDSGSQIRVTVSLDPALTAQAAADDTVFVFARAAQGPKMPLAIVRKQVRDLPVTVTLDDSLAMTPAMVLSNFPQVTVGARVSKSGQAMPQSGDLQGTVTPVASKGTQSVDLTINSTVP
jgi:cytochrome c-type biogenesis protein CcmH